MAESTNIIISQDIDEELNNLLQHYTKSGIFVFCDENTEKSCLPLINITADNVKYYTIPAGEDYKNIDTVSQLWRFLSNNGANRKSVIVNIGGGVLCDMGGFVACTFKRGVDFINIPTTLLSQVDASVGGKTGCNFNGLKNEIGIIQEPIAVLINTQFLQTITKEDFVGGYAEMLKHALIGEDHLLEELQKVDFENKTLDTTILANNLQVKRDIVAKDPYERTIRKALNFGHTVGHAIESLMMQKGTPISHGRAVAYGMIFELKLSVKLLEFCAEKGVTIIKNIEDIYGEFQAKEEDFPALIDYMYHDKKNEGSEINFTLLEDVGKFKINCQCTKEEIAKVLSF